MLASSSPRRYAILQRLGLPFRVVVPETEEVRKPGETVEDFVLRAAKEKGLDVADKLERTGQRPWIIAADTMVVIDDEPLGKPKNAHHARSMIKQLSGREHVVLTGWALLRKGDVRWNDVETTRVTFKLLRPEEIDAYVATREGLDKAGSYGIQGLGCFLVERLDGKYENVMGLPASPLIEVLLNHEVIKGFPYINDGDER